jgi:TolB-like protein/Tfp pilus assembly protein PilF
LYLLLPLGVDSEAIDSVAVLPFDNTGGDPDTEYLSDGITESLINSLSQLSDLRVVPRTTVFRYKGSEVDPQQIGRELRVRAVVTGRVAQRGENLVIGAELVDVSAESQLWGHQYTKKFAEILEVHHEISKALAGRLQPSLTEAEQQQLDKPRTTSSEAYELYLKGRYQWNLRTPESLRRGLAFFQQAVEKDPGYALAYVGLADSYVVMEDRGLVDPREAFPKAKEATLKALEIDGTLPEAVLALASLKEAFDWDWLGAEREYRRAIELDPNSATAHHWYSMLLARMGRAQEAIDEIRRARELDPASGVISRNVGDRWVEARQFDRALQEYQKALEMDPQHPETLSRLAWVHLAGGEHEKAISQLEKARAVSGEEITPGNLSLLGYAYAVAGEREKAQDILRQLQELSQERFVPSYDHGLVYLGLGDRNQALAYLEKGFEERSALVTWLKVDFLLDPLRDEPRFRDLLLRLDFPE